MVFGLENPEVEEGEKVEGSRSVYCLLRDREERQNGIDFFSYCQNETDFNISNDVMQNNRIK